VLTLVELVDAVKSDVLDDLELDARRRAIVDQALARPCGKRGESAWDRRGGAGVACARSSPADGCAQAFAERRRSAAAVARKRLSSGRVRAIERSSSSPPTGS
jgi:hypothetical protein